ncbi:MAG: 50S ribosomal protein L30 [Mycobacterium sp.]|nr:50S ribosomal protein L30 [Mycobacterium sp.]
MADLKITQVRSTIGARWKQRESLRTLGLRRIRHSVIREDNAETRGLIAVVRHLVEVVPAEPFTRGNRAGGNTK